ncbi:ATP-grasp domain-containing protein [uncultured Draconibacterium sp.]|uniref:ATP-grasp domain-containing protein n=1 Tax=uncultured Draconibacterium sp. TaxID=1573823 RepID=UPI0029C6ABC0|nr:ATP-grasp domain-containing protein [uncultured Draconibacterium sp.]
MEKNKVAIVLGGTNPHIALIENLKNRGYYTVLIDYTKNPPAKEYADEHLQESTLDKDLVVSIAKDYKAEVVISCCIDQANAIACYAAEKLSLPRPYSYKTAINVTDKCLMKDIMAAHNVRTSKHVTVSEYDNNLFKNFTYPLVTKPSDSTGSKGVRKANNSSELKNYIQAAIELSRTNKAVVEEFVEGFEIQIDCFIKNKKAQVVMIRQKKHVRLEGDFAMQTLGSTIPPRLEDKTLQQINEVANGIAQAFELNNSPLFIQAIVNNTGDVNVIEFAPRVGGGLSFRLIKMYSGFDFLDATIDSFFNIEPKIEIENDNSGMHLESVIIYANEGVYNKTVGQNELLNDGTIEEFFEFSTRGTQIGSDMSTRSRVCAFIIKGNSISEIIEKKRKSIEQINIWDINGDQLMKKELYL